MPPAKIALSDVRVLFTAAEIAARVDALAAKIVRTIPNDFVMVGLLKGAAVFVADLARAGARPEIEFMRLSSYGLAKESSGAVQLLGDIPAGLAGRPVLLVDDIVDYQPIDRLRLCPIAPPRGRRSLDLRAARQAPAAGGRGRAPFCRLLGRRPVRGGSRHRLRREVSPSALYRRRRANGARSIIAPGPRKKGKQP